MIELKTKLRKWGNSLGIVVPHNKAEIEKMKEGEEITVFLTKKENVLRNSFGLLKKWKKPTEKIMGEVDKELWKNE